MACDLDLENSHRREDWRVRFLRNGCDSFVDIILDYISISSLKMLQLYIYHICNMNALEYVVNYSIYAIVL